MGAGEVGGVDRKAGQLAAERPTLDSALREDATRVDAPAPHSSSLQFHRPTGTSDRHAVVERHVAELRQVVEVRSHARRDLRAFDDGHRAQARPQVDVVVGEAAFGAVVLAADELKILPLQG